MEGDFLKIFLYWNSHLLNSEIGLCKNENLLIYLNKINYPKDLKKFEIKDLKLIAEELRKKTIHSERLCVVVSKNDHIFRSWPFDQKCLQNLAYVNETWRCQNICLLKNSSYFSNLKKTIENPMRKIMEKGSPPGLEREETVGPRLTT